MGNINFNELAEKIHQNAKDKGFWDSPRNTGEIFMLIISEASEALEAHRKGKIADTQTFFEAIEKYESMDYEIYQSGIFSREFRQNIKDSTADEISDVVIRILDYCFVSEIEIRPALLSTTLVSLESNNFAAALFQICGEIQRAGENALKSDFWNLTNTASHIHSALTLIIQLCDREGIDISKHIELKMKYNATRERMHGKKY